MKPIPIKDLLDLDKLAREEIKRKGYRKRELLREISNEKDRHFLEIIGPIGVDKSTILRQLYNCCPTGLKPFATSAKVVPFC